jgi:hypothetical protein
MVHQTNHAREGRSSDIRFVPGMVVEKISLLGGRLPGVRLSRCRSS